MGWTDGTVSPTEGYLIEQRGMDKIQAVMPNRTSIITDNPILPEIQKQWNDFQKAKGRYEGSCDWTLLDEFVLGKVLLWLPQLIGSCVLSNSFRGYVIRQMYQVVFLGLAEEYFGRNEFGTSNYAFYAPYTYGMARKRANMRGGDGLYCEALVQSFLAGDIISCGTPALIELTKKLGVASDKDYPEPQKESVYRAFGDWKYLDELKPYAEFGLDDCPFVKSEEDLDSVLRACKPTFHCSGLAIKKVGEHKDGFAIHGRDPSTSWAHNMCYHGILVASDGAKFYRMSNESWGEKHLYNLPAETVRDFFKNRNVTAAAIGMIRSPKSAPPAV